MLLASGKFDVRQFPCLLEKRLLRAVKAEVREPVFSGHARNPILFHSLGRLWAKIDIQRTVGVSLRLSIEGIDRRTQRIANKRAGRMVVNCDRPELTYWNIAGHAQPVSLRAAQPFAFSVEEGNKVSLTRAQLLGRG